MIRKRFLVPVLALVGFGVPAGASVATYCSGSGCSTENNAQFVSDLSTDGYTLQALTNFSTSNGSLAGADYTDSASGVLFADYLGQSLSFSGTALSTPDVFSGVNYIEITLPSTVAAISIAVTSQGGVCLDAFCPANETSGFVGFINSNPLAAWTVEIGVYLDGNNLEINNFSVADVSAPTGNPDTPEVGTMLMIGAGLIGMRWMKRVPRRLFRTPQPAC